MAQKEMVIFTRTFDFLDWLLPRTNDFPRAHRHTVTRRLLDAAFDLRERLEDMTANCGIERIAACNSRSVWPARFLPWQRV